MIDFCDVCCIKKQVTIYKVTNHKFKIVKVNICNDCRNRDNASELTDEEFRQCLEDEYCDRF